MNLRAFVLEWTGRRFSLGIDWYALQFEPNPGFPLGLQLRLAWNLVPAIEAIDPLNVPDRIIETARRDAAEIYTSWGRRAGVTWSNFNRRQQIWYDPDQNSGLDVSQVHELLNTMFEAEKVLHH